MIAIKNAWDMCRKESVVECTLIYCIITLNAQQVKTRGQDSKEKEAAHLMMIKILWKKQLLLRSSRCLTTLVIQIY